MLKIIELFAGIGSQTQALKNIGVEHQVVAISDIDKFCDISYRAMHDSEVNNMGDITKIESLPEADLWTYSFPCTDISVAGKLAGYSKGSGTRSGLLWEVERLLLDAKERQRLPKYLLLENVKNLIGKNFKADYDKWLAFLNSLGYKNYWQVLNAKKYGIPQNRERVFCVSILGDEVPYIFPEPIPLELRLKDMLEDEVNEKYYLSEKQIAKTSFLGNKPYIEKGTGIHQSNTIQTKDIINTLSAGDYKAPPMIIDPKCIKVADLNIPGRMESACRVYSPNGLAPACNTCGGGGLETKIMEGQETSGIIYEKPLERKGWHNKACEVLNPNGITTCIHTQSNNLLQKIKVDYRIRKLTPKECWRLMGFTDEAFDKAKQSGMSNSQLYKQAGNSIVVNVLEAIFKEIL